MTYVYWFIIAGLVWNCVYLSRRLDSQRLTIHDLRVESKGLAQELSVLSAAHDGLVSKIMRKAEVVERLPGQPKRYTGPQLRVLNDRLNAQDGIQDRPNSEILKEQMG